MDYMNRSNLSFFALQTGQISGGASRAQDIRRPCTSRRGMPEFHSDRVTRRPRAFWGARPPGGSPFGRM